MADDWGNVPANPGAPSNSSLTCYSYVADTYEYTGQTSGDIDPLDPDNILWPANTTTVTPPGYAGQKIPVFDPKTKTWSVQPDYRGMYGYDPSGNLVMITRAGNPATFTPPLSKTPPNVDPPPPVDDNYAKRTSKVAFFRRTTDAEAAQFMADLAEASPRLKAIFDSVTYLIPGSEEYPDLQAAILARVMPERAAELLAPSED
jgi:hypothetical protein